MPVTQPTRELKPAQETEPTKNFKILKQPLKIHADFKVLPPVEKHHRDEHTHGEALRRRPRSRGHRHFPRYHYPDPYSHFFVEDGGYVRQHVPHLTNTYLRPNARFVGEQQSGAARYDIKVELKTVDLVSLVVTGFFQISGLTDEHPLITTCFKGEIINNPLYRLEWGGDAAVGRKYLFITEQRSWGSFPKNDLDHWRKLTGSPVSMSEKELTRKLASIHAGEDDTQYVYMRWKEEFLLPDLRIKLLKGASFEGFYYVVLNIGAGAREQSDGFSAESIPGTINGLYFHTQSDKFQSLSLRYVEDRGVSHAFEFA